jgi:chromosome segregation ATPase
MVLQTVLVMNIFSSRVLPTDSDAHIFMPSSIILKEPQVQCNTTMTDMKLHYESELKRVLLAVRLEHDGAMANVKDYYDRELFKLNGQAVMYQQQMHAAEQHVMEQRSAFELELRRLRDMVDSKRTADKREGNRTVDEIRDYVDGEISRLHSERSDKDSALTDIRQRFENQLHMLRTESDARRNEAEQLRAELRAEKDNNENEMKEAEAAVAELEEQKKQLQLLLAQALTNVKENTAAAPPVGSMRSVTSSIVDGPNGATEPANSQAQLEYRQQLEGEVSRLQQTVFVLEPEVQDLKAKLDEAEARIAELEKELGQRDAQLEQAERAIEQARLSKQDMHLQVSAANDKLRKAEAELKQKKEDLVSLKTLSDTQVTRTCGACCVTTSM